MHLAIGQGDLLVTPLQVAAFTAVIANGGVLYQPRLVDKIFDPQDNSFKQTEPKVIRQDFLSPNTIDIVAEGLRAAITTGSGRFLDSLPVAIAGKTGTAQSTPGKPEHAWFTGYLPFENPKLILTVLIENGGEGSGIAVPIAKDILDWYIKNRLAIEP